MQGSESSPLTADTNAAMQRAICQYPAPTHSFQVSQANKYMVYITNIEEQGPIMLTVYWRC